MASTYSPLLRYELIAAGEQAGVWGNTTNINIGSLIEQSVAGVTTIPSSSLGGTTYTLSALNGAPDEARSMVLSFTGSAASSFTVVVPTSQKLYVVRNATGQTINFKTVSQVTPYAVDTANSTMIFCDGTDVLPGIAAPSVGTLLVSGGGTGATSFTAGFVKSPGGTTALTSVSSINLAADVGSSILPVANGGTGRATLTSGSLMIGNDTTAPSLLTGTGTGNFLAWNGSAWAEASSLGTTKGGTGITSYSTGNIIYASGSNTLSALGIGTTGQVLTVSGGIPTWQTLPTGSGTVTSVAVSGGTTGLTVTGSPITTAGTITLGGTLALANGGTGATTASGARTNLGLGTMATASTTDYVNVASTQTVTGSKTFTGGISSSAYNFTSTSSIYYLSTPQIAISISGTTKAQFLSTSVTFADDTLPATDNAHTLGDGTYRWSAVYAANGTIQTSDAREKTDVEDAALGLSFVNNLRPVSYKWILGGKRETGQYVEETVTDADGNARLVKTPIYEDVPGVRTHYGFIAQEVKAALDAEGNMDFGGFILENKDDPSSKHMLRYEEFISPLVKAVQELSAQVTALQAEVAVLKATP